PLDVLGGELPVARRGPLGLDETLGLQKADLGDRDVREVRTQLSQHLPDGEGTRPSRSRSTHPRSPYLDSWAFGRSGIRLHARPRGPGLEAPAAGEVNQAELADLDLVTPGQQDLIDAVTVDVRAIEAADVAHDVTLRNSAELRMPAGHRHVIEEDVAIGMAPGGDDVAVEQEAAAGARPAAHNEQRATRRQRVNRGLVLGLDLLTAVALAVRNQRNGGRLLDRPFIAVHGCPALRAEAAALGILMPALCAERHQCPPQ